MFEQKFLTKIYPVMCLSPMLDQYTCVDSMLGSQLTWQLFRDSFERDAKPLTKSVRGLQTSGGYSYCHICCVLTVTCVSAGRAWSHARAGASLCQILS